MTAERATEAHGPAWLVQAATIARAFYLEGRSKVQIADDLGLSRFKVARILDEARELGLVEVSVRLPATIDPELSASVRERLGLRRVIVLGDGGDRVRDDLGRLAAELLTELVGPGDVLGLSCSRTVAAATQALTTLAPCEVIQLTGTLVGPDGEAGSVESVRRAASLGGGAARPIYAPMLLPDPGTARGLAQEPSVGAVLARIPSVSIALIAIGAWQEGLSTVWSAASAAEREAGARAGAVGEISGRLFDDRGRPVAGGVGDRVLGVTLEQLRELPDVVGLVHGADRAVAARGAVAGGLVTTLVCDRSAAVRLLELGPVR